MQNAFATPVTIAAWYMSSLSVILLNKHLLSYYGFHMPVCLALLHMMACVVFGSALQVSGFLPVVPLQSWNERVKVFLLATITACALVLDFVSLRYIELSLEQEIGATAPVFTAVFGYLIVGTVESFWTYLTLVPVTAGVLIACDSQPGVKWIGVATAVSAAILQGCKTTIQGSLLSDQLEGLDSFSLTCHASPLTVIWLLTAAAYMEPESVSHIASLAHAKPMFPMILLINCVLAFGSIFLTFLMTEKTSPLTVEVLGNVKGLFVTILSVALFHDVLTWKNCVAYSVVLAGVVSYSLVKACSDASVKDPLGLGTNAGPFGDVVCAAAGPAYTWPWNMPGWNGTVTSAVSSDSGRIFVSVGHGIDGRGDSSNQVDAPLPINSTGD